MKTYDDIKGPGATTLEVGDYEGKVVLKFPKPIEYAVLDPATAVQIAQAMVRAAKTCGWQKPIILLPTRH